MGYKFGRCPKLMEPYTIEINGYKIKRFKPNLAVIKVLRKECIDKNFP